MLLVLGWGPQSQWASPSAVKGLNERSCLQSLFLFLFSMWSVGPEVFPPCIHTPSNPSPALRASSLRVRWSPSALCPCQVAS